VPKLPKKKRKTRKRKRRARFLRRHILRIGLPVLLLSSVLLFLLHLDAGRRFRERMERFPSRIYSAGLILRPGMETDPDTLEEQLRRYGYGRTAAKEPAPGEYRRSWGRFEIHLRPGDGDGESRVVRARVRGRRMVSLFEADRDWIESLPIGSRPLGTFFGDLQEDRVPVRLQQTPEALQQAVLTMEDRRFRRHPGVDPFGIARAFLANLRSGRVVQGGSTLTQQLAKNLYHGNRRSLWRKGFELIVALDLELQFTKDEILEAYLNDIYLGQRGSVAISGVGAAAEYYFGKPVEDLELPESALLAALIRSPGNYNPRAKPDVARERRNLVLRTMADTGRITAVEALEGGAAPLGIAPLAETASRGSYLTDYLRRALRDLGLGRPLPRAGLQVLTTIEPELQAAAETAVRTGLERLEQVYASLHPKRSGKRLEAGFIAVNPTDGSILALVGGRDYRRSQFNRVDQARRQPGSLFKPFVYLTGFELGRADTGEPFTAATVLEDSPLEMVVTGKVWRPQNYDRNFRGDITARDALEKSLNVPTVRAAQAIGLDRIVDIARQCGIKSPMLAVPSIALGTMEVSPFEMAAGFSTIANSGRRVPLSPLISVSGPAGEIYGRSTNPPATPIVSSEAAWMVTDLMRGVIERGTAGRLRALGFKADAAAKTGTSDDTRDAWFVGFTPEVLALVWVGYDDGGSMGLSGSRAAAPIWADFMRRAGLDEPTAGFSRPRGIDTAWIDPQTGQRSTRRCPERRREQFIRGTVPAETCLLHGGGPRKSWRWLRGLLDKSD
jgi:penicillin-binding protein 1B